MVSITTPSANRPAAPESSRKVAWGRYALVALGTVVAAVLANLIVYYLGAAVVDYDPTFLVLATPGGTVIFTIIPAIVAPLLYAPILRFARRPERIFTIISVIVLVVSIIPDFTYIPTVPGSSAPQIAVLVLQHLVAALVITGILTRLTRPRGH